jgi:hypothetical protein
MKVLNVSVLVNERGGYRIPIRTCIDRRPNFMVAQWSFPEQLARRARIIDFVSRKGRNAIPNSALVTERRFCVAAQVLVFCVLAHFVAWIRDLDDFGWR